MNKEQAAGKWKQSIGKIKEKWGKLTNDDLDVIAGQRDQLVGRVQERYGIAKEIAEKQVNEFLAEDEAAESRRGRARRASAR